MFNAKIDFNSSYAMDIELLFKFLKDTQPETMDQLEKIYEEKTRDIIINHLLPDGKSYGESFTDS